MMSFHGLPLARRPQSVAFRVGAHFLAVAILAIAHVSVTAAIPVPARTAVLAWHAAGAPSAPAGFVPLHTMETGTVGLLDPNGFLSDDGALRALPSGTRILGSASEGSLLLVTRSTAAMVARGELPPSWRAALASARTAGGSVAEPTGSDLRAIPTLAADGAVALLRLPSWLAAVAEAPGCRAQRIDTAGPGAASAIGGAAAGFEPGSPSTLAELPDGSSPPVMTPAADPILLASLAAGVSTARMLTDLDTLSTKLHTRSSATPQFDTACQYALGVFQSLGLSASLDPFTAAGHAMTNVVAIKTGTLYPSRIVIISGHLDSTSPSPSTLAPGAEDNGSGSVGVLEAARLLANLPCESTIHFILFAGEEQGLYGSKHYATTAQTGGWDIRGMLTMDMIGYNDPSGVDLWIEGFHLGTSSVWLMNQFKTNAETYCGLTTYLYPGEGWGSDHEPFHAKGFPAVLAIENEYDSYACYHQTCDTVDKLDPAFMKKLAGAVLVTTAELAGVYALPDGVAPPPTARVSTATLRVVPNPAHGAFGIVLRLPAETTGRCEVYAVSGRRVATLAEGRMAAGEHILRWDGRDAAGRDAAAGMYRAAWVSAGGTVQVPVVLVK